MGKGELSQDLQNCWSVAHNWVIVIMALAEPQRQLQDLEMCRGQPRDVANTTQNVSRTAER